MKHAVRTAAGWGVYSYASDPAKSSEKQSPVNAAGKAKGPFFSFRLLLIRYISICRPADLKSFAQRVSVVNLIALALLFFRMDKFAGVRSTFRAVL